MITKNRVMERGLYNGIKLLVVKIGDKFLFTELTYRRKGHEHEKGVTSDTWPSTCSDTLIVWALRLCPLASADSASCFLARTNGLHGCFYRIVGLIHN